MNNFTEIKNMFIIEMSGKNILKHNTHTMS